MASDSVAQVSNGCGLKGLAKRGGAHELSPGICGLFKCSRGVS